jgi:hypothetical protein
MSTNLMEASTQWATRPQDQRFRTLEELSEKVKGRRLRSRSVDIDSQRTKVTSEGGKLIINGTITPCEPTHWSFGQLSTVIGAPAKYLRTLPQELLVKNLNHGLETTPRDTHKFMTIASEDESVNTLQAITSPTYGRIWDADCVDAVGRIVERSNGRFHNPLAYAHKGTPNGFQSIDTSKTERAGLYASDRDVFMFMIDGGSILEAGPRAELHRGFFVWNSEVGSKTFGLCTFLFNTVCGNNIVWGATDVNRLVIRHTSGGPGRFDSQAMPALLDYVNASAAPVEHTIKAASEKIVWDGKDASFAGLLEYLSKASKFSKSELRSAIDFAKAEEGDCRTLWQLVQGFTAYARHVRWGSFRRQRRHRQRHLAQHFGWASGRDCLVPQRCRDWL